MRKMTCNNPNLDLVNINAYIIFGENLSSCIQGIERKRTSVVNLGHNSGTALRKKACNKPNLDLVNMNAYIKFGEHLSSSSQDIGRKRNFATKRAKTLVQICEKGCETIRV